MNGAVRLERTRTAAGEIAVLSWARPERRNAMSRDMTSALAAAVAELARRPPAAAVLRGEGGDFSAGADLEDVRAVGRGDEEAALGYSRALQDLAGALERLPLPTVAAIDGVCLGLGLELALACTTRLASPRSLLGLPEMRHGLYPAAGGTARLPEAVGEGRAREMILAARVVDAAEAHALGVVDRVVPEGEVADAAIALAREWAPAGAAMVLFLAARRAGRGPAFETALAAERDGFARLVRSESVRERLDAFLTRRKGTAPVGPPRSVP